MQLILVILLEPKISFTCKERWRDREKGQGERDRRRRRDRIGEGGGDR